jgi:anti-sigma regulatory factor (Ser/Thr protein kinase)
MNCRAPVDWEMRRTLPASLPAAEEFLNDFLRQVKTLLNRVNCFDAELLVREALTNAVVHGCLTDPEKQVRCALRLNGGRLLFMVEDDGEGFNWRAAWARQAALSDCSGRGIAILRKYASHVRYNARGNAVTIVKRFC